MSESQNNQNGNTSNPVPANDVSAIEEQRYPDHFKAHVKAGVQYRVGDGVLEEIPAGTDVQVDTAIASYVLHWSDEDKHSMIVTIAKREFEHYVDAGDIQVAI